MARSSTTYATGPEWKGNARGPAFKVLRADQLPLITQMASEGKTERHIALTLGVSVPTWVRIKRAHQEAADALALGQEMLRDTLVGCLMKQAKSGNTIAAIYLSKALCGMSETDPSNDASRPQITINLPGSAPSIEQYAKGITIDAKKLAPPAAGK